jgi:flagellar hook-basal body complex protein FliE
MAIGGVIGVNSVSPVGAPSPMSGAGTSPAAPASQGTTFSEWLANALQTASDLSAQADALAAAYAAGEPVTVDQLMIAEQQASLALSLVVQTRDRVVNAYQTLMNMQL